MTSFEAYLEHSFHHDFAWKPCFWCESSIVCKYCYVDVFNVTTWYVTAEFKPATYNFCIHTYTQLELKQTCSYDDSTVRNEKGWCNNRLPLLQWSQIGYYKKPLMILDMNKVGLHYIII